MTSSSTIPHSEIEYRRDGTGDRAIAYLHGFLDDQDVWNPVITALAASSFETVRFSGPAQHRKRLGIDEPVEGGRSTVGSPEHTPRVGFPDLSTRDGYGSDTPRRRERTRNHVRL